MKKLVIIFLALISFTIFSVIVLKTPNNVLYLLNWGEYIDHDLVKKFEEENNCQVIEECVKSSEIMYQKISSSTTPYDVAIPGDYVVSQLYSEGKLKEIDCLNPEYVYLNDYQTMFTDSLKSLMNTMSDDTNIERYYMPYFWGAYSIIYSNTKDDVEDVVSTNGFKALYDRSLYNEDVKIGMYDTARWIVVSYLLSNGYNPNITSYSLNDLGIITSGTIDEDIQNDVVNALINTSFDEFGDDQLKRNVANGKLDMCFTQLGDFFDALYLAYDDGKEEIDFNVSVPDTTAAFFDSLVIPDTCHDYDLANKFINFMMNPNNAYQNANSIGYCPTLKEVCKRYQAEARLIGDNTVYYYKSDDGSVSLTLKDFLKKYPMYLDPLVNSTNYYLLEPKSTDYLTICEAIYNRGLNK